MTFRTSQSDALLFFAASPGAQDEYIVIQMKGGRLWFLFDPQGTSIVELVDDLTVAHGMICVALSSRDLQIGSSK